MTGARTERYQLEIEPSAVELIRFLGKISKNEATLFIIVEYICSGTDIFLQKKVKL